MDRVFNQGIGFVVIASPFYAESIRDQLTQAGYPAYPIGVIREGDRGGDWGGKPKTARDGSGENPP